MGYSGAATGTRLQSANETPVDELSLAALDSLTSPHRSSPLHKFSHAYYTLRLQEWSRKLSVAIFAAGQFPTQPQPLLLSTAGTRRELTMDPLSALGLASNIVQFVDFSCRLISESRKVYHSATGLPEDAIALQAIATDLQKMIDNLQISSARGTTSTGKLIRDLAFDCKAVADDLVRAVNKLANSSPDSKWKSFKTALQHVLRPEQVRKIAGGIAQLQSQVGLQLLALMSEGQNEIMVKLGEIEDNDHRLGLTRTVAFQQLQDDLLKALDSVQKERGLQLDSIKTHLDKMSAMQDCARDEVAELSDRMNGLQDTLMAFTKQIRNVSVEQTVLGTLAYKEASQRIEQVAVAHSDTFRWVFDENFSAGPRNFQTFAEWLRSDDGLCWIAGKPASGKSTLMKRILNDQRTREELNTWAQKTNHELCIGSYFFWIGGTALQKSQEGLLRSLLYDVFQQAPELILLVCNDKRLTLSNPYRPVIEPWKMSELLETFNALASTTSSKKKFCFFIDGLDEYRLPEEGSYDDLIHLLQRFSTCSNFKFCVASREENEFRDQYLTVNHFILQKLTVKDIGNYVHKLLNDSNHFRRLSSEDPAYLDLENEIVRRAQGVFLWVSLVVKTLTDGMRNSDTIADLQRELGNLPDSLETYFMRIIESIEPRYLIPAAKTLQVTNQAIQPLQLLAYFFLDDDSNKKTMIDGWPTLSYAEVDRCHEDARRRLTARCKGLLEIVEADRCELRSYFKYSVQYLHRSVRDFLYETTDMQAVFEGLLPRGFVAQHELCKAYLRLIDTIPLCPCGCDMKPRFTVSWSHNPFETALENFLTYAEYMWNVQSDPQIDLLREAERITLQRPKQWRHLKPIAFLGLAVKFGFTEYVRIRIEESPTLLREKSRSLLDYALATLASNDEHPHHDIPPAVRLEMTELLLRRGAPVERRLWCHLLQIIDHVRYNITRPTLVTIFALLVEHGANLDEAIVVGPESGIPKAARPIQNPSKREVQVQEEYTEQAISIIRAFFTPAEVETILRRQPIKTSASWWSWLDWRNPWNESIGSSTGRPM